ncbi:MAG TPA: AAA family ATPase [Acidimicrobiia bacterium]
MTVVPDRFRAGTARQPWKTSRAEVPRSLLIERLVAAGDRLVAVAAPAGYGKTTLLRQWAEADERPFAWVAADGTSNDPRALLLAIMRALDDLDPFGHHAVSSLDGAETQTVASVLHMGAVLATLGTPCVLVIDDVHHLVSPHALLVVSEVSRALPSGSRLVLSGRCDATLDLELLPGHVFARPLRVGASDLAFDATEGELLLGATGVLLDAGELETVMRRTEGWPTALAIAAMSLDDDNSVDDFDGGDRRIVDYVDRAVLDQLEPTIVDFLLQTAVLEELTPSLCDAVSERDDSAQLLERLHRANLFVVPLDSRAERFRYHRLFREALQHELHRRDPLAEQPLHRRASGWYTAHGRLEPAIRHSIAASDDEHAAWLVWQNAPTCITRGQVATLQHWLDAFGEDQTAGHPLLALTAASVDAVEGRADEATHWLWVAQHSASAVDYATDEDVEAHALLLRSLLSEHGLAAMQADATRAFELDRDASPWRALAGLYLGVTHHLAGDDDAARRALEDALVRSAVLWPSVHANCLAELALLDAESGAWERAAERADLAQQCVAKRRLDDHAPVAIVPAVAALTLVHRREARSARECLGHGQRLVRSLGRVAPALRAETLTVLARAALLSGDTAMTKELLRELRPLVAAMPEAVALRTRVDELDVDLEVVADTIVGPLALTAAELRVLGYLPMHLSMAEIAEKLYVSRNTVKSQAIAIYRKLAVSSRGAAVSRARELGLLDT